MMIYQEFLPAPELRPYIHLYGILEMPERLPQQVQEKVLPLPGSCLLLCSTYRQPVYIYNGFEKRALPPVLFIEQGSKNILWTHQGGLKLFFVLFKPGSICPFLTRLATQATLNLAPTETNPAFQSLHYQLQQAKSHREQMKLVNSFFQNKLHGASFLPGQIQQILSLIHTDPRIKLTKLSQKLFICPRHLRRAFKDNMGLSLKRYQQIIRISRSLQQLHERKFQKISDVAYQWGFFDQTHFNRIFKDLTDLTPREYLQGVFPLTSSLYWREWEEK